SNLSEKAKETAKSNIYALKICDMRYFEEYLNEFQEYYCTIGELENTDLVNLLHRKLPKPWRTAVRESIAEKPIERFS
ncbi:hypothetical protein PSY24_23525, partial [Shigella flexneri]|nr:hypothetical protein [Shigella flexneri]